MSIEYPLEQKTREEKGDFNNAARHWAPEDEEGKQWIEDEKKRLEKLEYSYYTFFDNLDADEKRF